jgi:hypothetical protein
MPTVPMWRAGGFYTAGCVVQHDGRCCMCRRDHIGGTTMQMDMAFGNWAVISAEELNEISQLANVLGTLRDELGAAGISLEDVLSPAPTVGISGVSATAVFTQEQAEAAFIAATETAMREGQMARDNNRRPPPSLADAGLENTFNSVDRNMAASRQQSNRPSWRGPAARRPNQPVVLPNQPAIPRVEEDRSVIWSSATTWRCPGPDGRMVVFNIEDMEDKLLWNTINWAIEAREALHAIAIQANASTPMLGRQAQATTWLAAQPAFLGLVHEAIRREFTFSDESANFLESALKLQDVQTAEPWEQRQAGRSLNSIQASVAARVHANQHIEATGRAARPIIDLSEDIPG